MKRIFKGLLVPLLLLCLSILSGCGDEEGIPFWVEALDPVIDLSDPSEDMVSMVTATIFDTDGTPMEEGTMLFTLNDDSFGYLLDEDGNRVKRVGVDIEDGVAEVVFTGTNKPETAVIAAYCPGYPRDDVKKTTVRVINGTFKADFRFSVSDDGIATFYDESGFNDRIGQTIALWTWSFQDDANPRTIFATHTFSAPADGPYPEPFTIDYSAYTGTVCRAVLTITGSDGETDDVAYLIVIP